MFCLAKPGPDVVRRFLSAQEGQPYSYPEVGGSRQEPPTGYAIHHSRVELGLGAAAFERARGALQSWKMFDMPWVDLCWPNAPIAAGATVAVVISHLGFWSVDPCRVVYVIQETGLVQKFEFAYGTLPEHKEVGEERFTVEYDTRNQVVWYDLFSFSRPGPIARLGYPFARALQKRFARDSQGAMKRAV